MFEQLFCKKGIIRQNTSICQNVQAIFRCSDMLEIFVTNLIRN